MDPEDSGNLAEQVAELRARVLRLEAVMRQHGVVLPGEEARRPPEREPAPARPAEPVRSVEPENVPAPGPVVQPPRFGHVEPETAAHDHSLEARIGSQWFNRIGILAVLIGMAWFLKLAIDNHWIGPAGRVGIGLVAGAALVAWSERFRAHGYAAFSYSLKAVGSGILYLSLWAAFQLYQLIPASVAFGAMIAVTAFNGYLAWAQESELLALYAIVGGLSTPLLVSTGQNHEVTLFSYLMMLDATVLVLVALRPWSRLLAGAFMGTVLFASGWWFAYYTPGQAGRTAFFLGGFYLMFAFAPRLVRVDVTAEEHPGVWDQLVMVPLPLANAALGFLAFYALLDSVDAGWAQPWLAAGFAAFYLLLLWLPARGRWHGSPALLSALHLAAAVVFLTLAIPLKADGRWLPTTTGWLVEGAALLAVASRMRSVLLRVLALLCLALGLLVLLAGNPEASAVPFFNQRFATYCVGIAVFAFVAWLAHKAHVAEHTEHGQPWGRIMLVSSLLVNLLVLVAIGWEIHSYWWVLEWRGDMAQLRNFSVYAQFTYSAFFMLFGAVLLGAGFWRRWAFLRWQALVLLALSIGKVFLIDMNALSRGYRILSFLGLGALLLGVSFLYQRDWLHLRGDGGQEP